MLCKYALIHVTSLASGCVRQTYFFRGPTAVSQLFHHVHVTGIPYGKTIYYKCSPALRATGWSFFTRNCLSVRSTSCFTPFR